MNANEVKLLGICIPTVVLELCDTLTIFQSYQCQCWPLKCASYTNDYALFYAYDVRMKFVPSLGEILIL